MGVIRSLAVERCPLWLELTSTDMPIGLPELWSGLSGSQPPQKDLAWAGGPSPIRRRSDLKLPRVAVVLGLGSGVLGVDALGKVTVERSSAFSVGPGSVPAKGIVPSNARPLVIVVLATE